MKSVFRRRAGGQSFLNKFTPTSIVASKTSWGQGTKVPSVRIPELEDSRTKAKVISVLSGLLLLKLYVDQKSEKVHAEQRDPTEAELNNFDPSLNDFCNHNQYPANFPIEDRFIYQKLDTPNGYVFGVFDGHGGWQFSHFLAQNLPNHLKGDFNKLYKSSDSQNSAKKALGSTFDDMEAHILDGARKAYSLGFGRGRRAGSCAVIATVVDGVLTIANSGDSQAVLCREVSSTALEGVEVSFVFNAMNPQEQARMKREFPDQDDIYYCKRPDCCYVKRRLQPTRSFGDFDLKYKEFNNPNGFGSEYAVGRVIPNYTGGYITHTPDFTSKKLTEEDRYLILATDGLWDELTAQEAAEIVAFSKGDTKAAAENLRLSALIKAAENEKMTLEELTQVRLDGKSGKSRRNIHDDITVVVVDLHRLAAKNSS